MKEWFSDIQLNLHSTRPPTQDVKAETLKGFRAGGLFLGKFWPIFSSPSHRKHRSRVVF